MVRRRQELQLDDNLKQLMKELGAAINDALSESEDISEAIQNVRNAGYDVFLVLEATIGFNKRAKGEGSEEANAHGLQSGEMKLKVTAQDLKFLRSLKISVENLDQQQ
jgi:4-aminobutyrate aminotransferase-like enzyme